MVRLKHLLALCLCIASLTSAQASDTIPGAFEKPLEWRIGAQLSPSIVLPTNSFLRGDNPDEKRVNSSFSGSLRADFSFNKATKEGILYKDLYQGIGVGPEVFFSNSPLGTPVSAYVYQGMPIVHFSDKLSLGYEWKFGAAFGWKHDATEDASNPAAVSTAVTAIMGLGIHMHYTPTDRVQLTFGVEAKHFSNGNTHLPNAGVNSVGLSLGVAYLLNPHPSTHSQTNYTDLTEEADRGKWLYDIMAYAAWRKRIVNVGYPPEQELCPGKFGVVGLQFSPLRKLNRYVAVGPALDLQWDESAGLEPYWVEGSYDENIKFERPPFGKQISLGVSGHAELTMPIFSVNAGLGVEIINPKGDKRFYQSLTLKTFLTKNIYLNVGYRLGKFKDPQNLMLGVGVRL